MNTISPVLGTSVESLRRKKSISKDNLSEELGFNYSSLESGDCYIELEKLLSLAKVLSVQAQALLVDEPIEEKKLHPSFLESQF